MAARLLDETDVITVASLAIVIFGPPGCGKTSLGQTAEKPFTLDFDKGLHRSQFRKQGAQFDLFRDVADPAVQQRLADCQTVVVDTIGRLLDTMSLEIMDESPKYGNRGGGLSLQGFGVLKSRFGQWIGQLRARNKDVVLLCHEKEEKDGDDRIMRPDIQGGSYAEVHKVSDLIGYLSIDRSGRRTLNFSPTDRHIGKNAAGWDVLPVGKLEENPRFLADLLTDAKARIGKTAEASAALAKLEQEWKARLDADPMLDTFNSWLPEVKAMGNGKAVRIKDMLFAHAETVGWTFDAGAKRFFAKTSAEAIV